LVTHAINNGKGNEDARVVLALPEDPEKGDLGEGEQSLDQ